MTGQRALAALLTFLLFALIITGSVAVCRALKHPGWGWVIGIGICVMMVVGFLVQSRSERAPAPAPGRAAAAGNPRTLPARHRTARAGSAGA